MSAESVIDSIISNAISNANTLVQNSIDLANNAVATSSTVGGAFNAPTVNPTFISVDPTQYNPISDLRSSFDNEYNGLISQLSTIVPNTLSTFLTTYFPQSQSYSDQMQAYLWNQIQNGGMGLPPDVEESIVQDARARLMIDLNRIEDEAYNQGATKGFSVPSQVLLYRILQTKNDATRHYNEINIKEMIDQNERRIEWVKFAIAQLKDFRTEALRMGLDYLKDILETYQLADSKATHYVDSYKTFYDALYQYYGIVNRINEIRLNTSVESAKVIVENQKVNEQYQVGLAEVRAKGAVAAADAMAKEAAAALSGMNAFAHVANITNSSS